VVYLLFEGREHDAYHHNREKEERVKVCALKRRL
jgi:hypothetical protein